MDVNLKSDLQETCLTLLVNSTICHGCLACDRQGHCRHR